MGNMGRPRTERGQWGTITFTPLTRRDDKWVKAPEGTRPGRWRARVRYRDENGRLQAVQREATAKGRAEQLLKDALHNWTTPVHGAAFSADLSLREAGALWLDQKRRPESGVKASSLAQYEANFARYVRDGTIAERTLRDVNAVPVLRPYLQRVADDHGAGAAKTARTVVSGILTMAVEDGVLTYNAAHNVRPPQSVGGSKDRMSAKRRALVGEGPEAERNPRRALTREERDRLLTFIAQDEAANRLDIVDVLRWMAGTGVRISEALDQRWEDLDLDAGTGHVRGTKTIYSDRVVPLADWLVDHLRERQARGQAPSGYLFPSPRTGEQRDRRNAARAARDVLDRAGFPWATPHTFRRTAATFIGDAGMGAHLAADVLGHADPSFTQRVYYGRKTDTSRAAAVL